MLHPTIPHYVKKQRIEAYVRLYVQSSSYIGERKGFDVLDCIEWSVAFPIFVELLILLVEK